MNINTQVVSVETLPPVIREKINAAKVTVQEHDGGVILMPVREDNSDIWGLLTDGRLTSEKFLIQKRLDKELEP